MFYKSARQGYQADTESLPSLRASPTGRQTDRRSSFGILGEAALQSPLPGEQKVPGAALSLASRLSSFTLYPADKKMSHSVDGTGTFSLSPSEKGLSYSVSGAASSFAASTDRLPQYRHSLSVNDWNGSDNTLVAVARQMSEQQEQHPHQIPIVPPTRPPRTRSTRIPHSLRTMLSSSTSRYASVIHFFQDSNSPTPTPTPLPQAQRQSCSINNSHDHNHNGWTVTRIAPPRRPSTPAPPPPPGWI